MTPAGLSLIDPSDWSVRHLSDEASWVTFRGGALLASAWNPETEEQTLEVLDPEGSLRFTLAREAVDLSQVGGDRLYATTYSGAVRDHRPRGTAKRLPKRPEARGRPWSPGRLA